MVILRKAEFYRVQVALAKFDCDVLISKIGIDVF